MSSEKRSKKTLTSYDRVAGFYDVMSDVYSFGQIKATKLDQLNYLNRSDRVLFVGCGAGIDVVEAAKNGCDVTAVDTSEKMLNKLQQRLNRESLAATLICDKIQNINNSSFDVVCPNFFLNCFSHDLMELMLEQVADFVRDDGIMMIADVAPPKGNVLARTTNQVYLHGAMLPFWLAGMVQWHPNHDYVAQLTKLGWDIQAVNSFRMLKLGPTVFRNIVAKKTRSRT